MPPGVTYTDVFRVQFSYWAENAPPEDRFVATFHLRNDGGIGEMQDRAIDAVQSFYFDLAGGQTLELARYLAADIATGEFRVYNMGLSEPRAPLKIQPLTAEEKAKFTGTQALPYEVAAAVTWRSNVNPPKVGTQGRTGRGRTYLGPLSEACRSYRVNTPILDPTFRDDVAAAALGLLGRTGEQLVVLSPTYQATDEVVGGWIDEAFDTQRRRGIVSTDRTTFRTSDATYA